MAKQTNHLQDFRNIKLLNNLNSTLFWLLILLNIVPEICKKVIWKNLDKEVMFFVINYLIIILFCASFIVSILVEYYLIPTAESRRRSDYFENSFHYNFQLDKSIDYFTNDKIVPGVYKMGVNLFQNLFFTTSVTKKMIPKEITKSVIGLFSFVSMSFIGFRSDPILLTLFQALFSLNIIGQTIKFFVFRERNNLFLKNIQVLFAKQKDVVSLGFCAQIVKLYTDYECNISWGAIVLNEKIFNTQNDLLEKEWFKIKTKYDIR